MNRGSNTVATSAVALAPPPHPPQPNRPSTSCDLHPDERFSGFCPSCLFNRLSLLKVTTKDATASSSSSKKPPSSAALKSTVKLPSLGTGTTQQVIPELRRTKSFSAGKNEVFSLGAFEPQRRSCDVRVRNTLWSLFNDDCERNSHKKFDFTGSDGAGRDLGEIELKPRNYRVKSPDLEETSDSQNKHDDKESRSVIEPVHEIVEEVEIKCEIREEERKKLEEEQMELNPQTKKPNREFKDIAGSFWSAASVFSKKLQKWRQKQKLKKHRNGRGIGSAALPVEKTIGRQMRDTQSEIADYGFGRRSCDTDPRFSIDAGRFSLDAGRISLDAARVSIDDNRYSFDEPRASWDGYLIGRMAAPPRMPSMLSVVEDSPIHNHTLQSDEHIPVEEPALQLDENIPGGTAQTREYYADSCGRRRKSLDRCSSTRKAASSVMAEIDELKLASASNTKLSQDRDPKDSQSRSNSLRDDCSVDNLEIGFRENAGIVDSKKEMKKSRRWNWNIFKLLNRKNESKYEDDGDEIFNGSQGRNGNGVERSLSGFADPRMMRSSSSVSWRSSGNFAKGEFQRNSVDGYISKKGKNGRKVENGTLRFYLTPMRGNRRGSSTGTNPIPVSRPGPRNVMNF